MTDQSKNYRQVLAEQQMVDKLCEVLTYLQGRPTLTSVTPICKPHQKVEMAICETCGTMKGFTFPEQGSSGFPESGYWTECRACAAWRMFYRVHAGHIVRDNYHE